MEVRDIVDKYLSAIELLHSGNDGSQSNPDLFVPLLGKLFLSRGLAIQTTAHLHGNVWIRTRCYMLVRFALLAIGCICWQIHWPDGSTNCTVLLRCRPHIHSLMVVIHYCTGCTCKCTGCICKCTFVMKLIWNYNTVDGRWCVVFVDAVKGMIWQQRDLEGLKASFASADVFRRLMNFVSGFQVGRSFIFRILTRRLCILTCT